MTQIDASEPQSRAETEPTTPPVFEAGGATMSDVNCQPQLIALFENLVNVMFCIKSGDGVYTEVNRAFLRRTGRRSKREVIGHTARDIFNPDLAERYEEQDRQVIETGLPMRDALELIRRQDASLGWYLTTKIPVPDPDHPEVVAGLVSVSRDLLTATEEGIALARLQNVVAYVREHLDETVRVGTLAEVAECSVDQLDRRIRKVFGLTAKQYLLRVRVDRATELLRKSDMALAEVATVSGFYDQSDFTKRFARLTNQTPAQFRASNRTP